jgi:glycine betaine catabolism B
LQIQHYQALLNLVSGLSFFAIMLLVLRLLSLRNQKSESPQENLNWSATNDLIIVEVITETHNIKSFRLKRSDGKRFPPFKAGQFLSFQIGEDSKQIRSYSLSSPENDRQIVQVSVKMLKDGLGSTWFHNLKKDDILKVHAPSGHFVDSKNDKNERIYIAGGVGITPILSLITTNLNKALDLKLTLFYAVRSKEDLAFHGLLDYLSKRHKNFSYFPILSHEKEWPGDQGFLNLDFIKSKLHNFANKEFYVCGPGPMTEPLLDQLDQLSIPDENIFTEKFISPSSLDDHKIESRQVKVKWFDKQLSYSGRLSVLEFLESSGVDLNYACRTGVCGSCKCKIKGPIKMLTNAGLSRKEQKEGYSLACVSYPEGDIEVSL